MRVEAVWVPDDELGPTHGVIKWFRPNGEPTPTKGEDRAVWRLQGVNDAMRDVAIVSFAQTKHERVEDGNEVEMLMPVFQEALDAAASPGRHRVHRLGVPDYLAGRPSPS